MELPDITQLTEQQWDQLVASIQQAKETRRSEREQALWTLKKGVWSATGELDRLIGPDQPLIASVDSLTEMSLFTDQQIQNNLVKAVKSLRSITERIARTVRDMAAVDKASN